MSAFVGGGGGGAGAVTFSAGASSAALSSLIFSNSNGVSWGLNGSTLTATVQTNYLTTAMASNRGSDFVQATAAFAGTNATGTIASDGISVSVNATVAQTNQTVGLYASSNTYLTSSGTVDARSLTFRGDKSITVGISAGEVVFSVGAYLTTAMASNRGSDFVQATAGFNGTNCSGTIASNSVSVSVGNYITTADLSQNSSKYVQNWKLTGNTAGTTSSAQGTDLWFSGGNSITVSGNSNTIVLSVGNYITTADLSQNSSKYAGTNGAITGGSITVNTSGVSVNVSAIKALGASNTGNTAGNTGVSTGIDWVLAGSNNITVSESTAAGGPNTLWVSGPTVVANTLFDAGISNLGNTSGTSGQASVQYVLVGTNGITLSQSLAVGSLSGTLTISGAGGGGTQTIGASNLGNTLGTSGVATGSGIQYAICATDGVSISQSINGASGTGTIWPPVVSQYDPFPFKTVVSNSTIGQNSLIFYPFDVPVALSAYRINFFFSVATTVTAGNSTGKGGYTFSACLYSRGTGTGTDRISSMWSDSWAISLSINSNTQIAVTHPWGISAAGGTTQVSSTNSNITNANATTYIVSSVGGWRVVPMPISSTLTPGRYWMAAANSTTSSNAGACIVNCSVMQQTIGNQRMSFAEYGTSSTMPNDIWNMFAPYTSTSNAFPATVPLTTNSFQNVVINTAPLFNFSGYTTGTGWA